MTDKAKLALVGAVAAVIFASPALAQTINGGDETGNASSYSYQPAASDAAVRHAGARAARRMHMRWSGACSRIPLNVPARLSIQTIRRSLAAAALATTNCWSRKVTDHPCTKKVGRTRFAPLSLQSVGPNRSDPCAIASPLDGNWSVVAQTTQRHCGSIQFGPRNKPRLNFPIKCLPNWR